MILLELDVWIFNSAFMAGKVDHKLDPEGRIHQSYCSCSPANCQCQKSSLYFWWKLSKSFDCHHQFMIDIQFVMMWSLSPFLSLQMSAIPNWILKDGLIGVIAHILTDTEKRSAQICHLSKSKFIEPRKDKWHGFHSWHHIAGKPPSSSSYHHRPHQDGWVAR